MHCGMTAVELYKAVKIKKKKKKAFQHPAWGMNPMNLKSILYVIIFT